MWSYRDSLLISANHVPTHPGNSFVGRRNGYDHCQQRNSKFRVMPCYQDSLIGFKNPRRLKASQLIFLVVVVVVVFLLLLHCYTESYIPGLKTSRIESRTRVSLCDSLLISTNQVLKSLTAVSEFTVNSRFGLPLSSASNSSRHLWPLNTERWEQSPT